VIGQDAFGGGPVLLFQISQRRPPFLDAPEDETVRWALQLLTDVVGDRFPSRPPWP